MNLLLMKRRPPSVGGGVDEGGVASPRVSSRRRRACWVVGDHGDSKMTAVLAEPTATKMRSKFVRGWLMTVAGDVEVVDS